MKQGCESKSDDAGDADGDNMKRCPQGGVELRKLLVKVKKPAGVEAG